MLSTKVYSHINDKNTLDNVKFVKFLHYLSSKFKTKIQENGITDYDKAGDITQTLLKYFNSMKFSLLIPPIYHWTGGSSRGLYGTRLGLIRKIIIFKL